MLFGGNTTCLQLTVPATGELLVFDCGTGFRNLGNLLANKKEALKGKIFITHPHWDHLQGFPFFKPFYKAQNRFHVYIPPQSSMSCREILQEHMVNSFFPITFDMMDAEITCETFEKTKKEFDGCSVEYMWMHHTIPTAAYKITCGGKTIIFAPDNELADNDAPETQKFLAEFEDFIRNADVLIHDAQYNPEQYARRRGWGHSSWLRVVEVAANAGVKQLFLSHHDPDSSDEYLSTLSQDIERRFSSQFRQITLVREGQEVILPLDEVK